MLYKLDVVHKLRNVSTDAVLGDFCHPLVYILGSADERRGFDLLEWNKDTCRLDT